LDKLSGDKVDLATLKEAGLIRSNSNAVKILGTGEVTKAFVVEVSKLSKSAKQKIEAAGGSIKE
jgi:large subunit ribosomal protein L15